MSGPILPALAPSAALLLRVYSIRPFCLFSSVRQHETLCYEPRCDTNLAAKAISERRPRTCMPLIFGRTRTPAEYRLLPPFAAYQAARCRVQGLVVGCILNTCKVGYVHTV